MLFEILSTSSMAGVVLSTYYFQHKGASNDHEKIVRIANEAGLKTNEAELRIYRKSHDKKKNVTEYVYKMPLGLSLKQFQDKKHLFVDGLNNKSRRSFTMPPISALKSDVNWKDISTLFTQLQNVFMPRVYFDKELDITYDGMIKFRVYERGLEKMYPYDDALLSQVKNWQIPIGYDRDGLIKHDFETMQMMVVAGMTRYGKTVMLKNIITTLIHNEPDNSIFTLIDLKGGLAFNRFSQCKQVRTVAKNQEETLVALEQIHQDMLAQQQEFLKNGYEDISEAGYSKRHFIVIDEGAEIAGFTDSDIRDRCTHLIGEIARIGAGLSYRMVFATQYPTADVFPRAVKSNTSASLCFRLKTATQSTVVLDRAGAEELPVGLRGRAIYQSDKDIIVQTPYIPNDFIDEKVKIHFRAKPSSNSTSPNIDQQPNDFTSPDKLFKTKDGKLPDHLAPPKKSKRSSRKPAQPNGSQTPPNDDATFEAI